jgi:hypothetical protein
MHFTKLRLAATTLALAILAIGGSVTTAADAAVSSHHGCPSGYLCLYEHTNYGGTMHRLYNCEYYYTPYQFDSLVNNQTGNAKAYFYAKNDSGNRGALIWTRTAYFESPDTRHIAGNLGLLTFYVKPC